LHANGRASGNGDEVRGRLATVADHGSGGNILDGVVSVGRSLDSEVLALVLSVKDEALESSVGSGELGNSQDDSGLGEHVDGCLVVRLLGCLEVRVNSKIE
jgi:hypothetical protein